jgi:hypothetical protein
MTRLSVCVRPPHTVSGFAALALAAGIAHAQWTFVNLSPPTLNDSRFSAVVGGAATLLGLACLMAARHRR